MNRRRTVAWFRDDGAWNAACELGAACVPSRSSASSGCTIGFATIGGVSASSSNRAARARHEPETASVGGRILAGALLGLVVDGLVIRESMKGCCPDFGSNHR